MAIPNIFGTAHSGMSAAKTGIATAGHNISNANTEGFSRQKVQLEASTPSGGPRSVSELGTGVRVARVTRVNDDYLEKQIRNSGRDVAHHEEKELALKQIEDCFNELDGGGFNGLIARFFNEFRKLANEPESFAVRQSVREATQAVVNDFHRMNQQLNEIRQHLDSRISGYVNEVNSIVSELASLNVSIKQVINSGEMPNDLMDQRDVLLKRLASFFDISVHFENDTVGVDIRGAGPLLSDAGQKQTLSAEAAPADESAGRMDGALEIRSTGGGQGTGITQLLRGGRLGALIEARDQTLSSIVSRMDEIAYGLVTQVNEIHEMGVSLSGLSGVFFFRPLFQVERASEMIQLSDDIRASVNNIAAGASDHAPGDNRNAILIAGLQSAQILNDEQTTIDDYFNGIMSDVGVLLSQNRFALTQQKDILTHLGRVREQVSGVSIDEETSNLLQFQHLFDASAKVIQVADEMLRTVLSLKRD